MSLLRAEDESDERTSSHDGRLLVIALTTLGQAVATLKNTLRKRSVGRQGRVVSAWVPTFPTDEQP